MQFTSALFSVLAIAGLAAALPQATPTATASATATPTCSPGPTIDYTVVSNDTLTIISQKYSSGICDIANASNLTNPNFIALGQVLKVPTYVCNPDNTSCLSKPGTGTCVEGGAATYTIVAGDTFFIVAERLGLDVNVLLAANQGVDPLLLQVGDVINIPVC
ncbi:intracellular hyphae protein 1 [Colletotrichum abscissum]|uniref:Intracellular hyphae protein 1 n=3 Tax=Colletotrichum acutatum species complex TaxID=2707335 RepID=A0A9Q0B918_9PEZI|nr:intracellular hyphae protein 1 [Colletotrichum costaricense]XP_060376442.1 intracellular hyphae protein 1 [Colletotrichum tamarilloi]XP_060394009.1 intracellular hyphae protein 1 [Colletotrichum abscissum]KAI3558154.1 intracellular hyphae protein 1 [Colletotrichum abscissum]KAK1482983.1 intracellular hyphae protein 1 [Colletotrichum abscissum]KAK1484512.1 intracellular hyphae protein 1 [Colletotrichum tamarilloi]KAK1532287.1 intracellular hyphae protein 1 [Colletotrichum costaricense]